jgi:hypothetical protein
MQYPLTAFKWFKASTAEQYSELRHDGKPTQLAKTRGHRKLYNDKFQCYFSFAKIVEGYEVRNSFGNIWLKLKK